MSGQWTLRRAEEHLLGLELFGMRFGLDRMHRLMTALGLPQHRFRSIHVVGTNGKSSTVRMTAALLAEHGLRVGSYLSPHLVSFAERIRIGDADLAPGAFARAVQRAAHAAELVDRSLAREGRQAGHGAPGPDAEHPDRCTQFEVLTAAAYAELAAQGVDVAVVEAGLGGRWDATNVIPSEVQVLTNVGLEHTRWLGPTTVDIAREKLAVVQPGATLVVGELDPGVEAEAEAVAAREGARLIHALAPAGGEEATPPAARISTPSPAGGARTPAPLAAAGSFQRRNFAVAQAAAEALLGRLDRAAVVRAAASVRVPGRFEIVGRDPLTIVDGAHNPSGVAVLVESLAELAAGRRVVAVVSILDDKDATTMLRTLLPACDAVVFTSNHSSRALSPATLESLARQLGGPPAEVEPDPRRALARARALAGDQGVVLAAGSIYLVGDLLPAPAGRRASSL